MLPRKLVELGLRRGGGTAAGLRTKRNRIAGRSFLRRFNSLYICDVLFLFVFSRHHFRSRLLLRHLGGEDLSGGVFHLRVTLPGLDDHRILRCRHCFLGGLIKLDILAVRELLLRSHLISPADRCITSELGFEGIELC